jgi:beta-galactosidase GanA
MSARSTRPKAPTPVDTPTQPASTAAAAICAPGQLRLDQAQAYLAATCDALNGWYARRTSEGHSYIAHGHEAIRLIDAATQQLHRVRAALVGEIRADEDERAARADRMLTDCRTRHIPDDEQRPRNGGAA